MTFNKRVLLITTVGLGAVVIAGAAGATIAWNLKEPTYQAPLQISQNRETSESIGTTSATELSSLIDTATALASGTAVSIEANRNGSWDVELEDAPNAETTIRIAADGSASVIEVDNDFDFSLLPSGSLTPENISRAVDTALADVSGTIVGLSVDDGIRDVYSIDVLSTDGLSRTELDLNSSFIITERETDYNGDD